MKPVICLALALIFTSPCFSQNNPAVLSPEVLPDRRVVFRVAAPKASEVGVFIDTMKTGTQEPLTRGADGIWSTTLGPFKPGIYIYNFILDGVSIADPVNPKMKLRARTSASLLEVPGEPPEFWEAREVPHGTVQINYHKATTLNGEVREVWVYTPPGYERNRGRRYPVFYLLHGSNDTPAGWTQVGRIHFTMDNLLAEKSAKEMIIVTPFGHAVPFGAGREANRNNLPLFKNYLLTEVIPMIESKYRTARGRNNRAIAGFSMGGDQALQIGLGHLDLFSAIGVFSAGAPENFEERFGEALGDAQKTNDQLKLFWIACGRDDFLFDRSKRLSEILGRHAIRHAYRQTEGGHTYNVWREYFAEFAPLLFTNGERKDLTKLSLETSAHTKILRRPEQGTP